MAELIAVENLVKVYPDGTRAVDDVSFSVAEGEIFGFLGPNGAGKTTTIRILVTLLPKTSGRAVVGGVEVSDDPEAVRRMIGYAAQFIAIDDDLTALENLVLQGRLHGTEAGNAARRAEELLEVFSLTDVADKRAAAFSGGMRRRLDLAQALVHRPPLVFLDEPTAGLDPQNRNALWRHLKELNLQGTTIFLTTQYLEEADQLCERIGIIDHGQIAVMGSPSKLKSEVGSEVVTVELADAAGDDVRSVLMNLLAEFPGAGEPTVFNGSVAVPVEDAGRRLSALVRRFDEAGLDIHKLSLTTPSLDEVFLRYTGERLRTEDTGRTHSPMLMGRRMRRG